MKATQDALSAREDQIVSLQAEIVELKGANDWGIQRLQERMHDAQVSSAEDLANMKQQYDKLKKEFNSKVDERVDEKLREQEEKFKH